MNFVSGIRRTRAMTVGLAMTLGFAGARGADESLPDKIVFNRDIRPIFSNTCFKCHGPDANKRKANLRMDIREDAVVKHENGIPLVPGNPAKSEAYQRLISKDPEQHMPPLKSNLTLTGRQIQLMERWIKQGAEYQPHWAFVAPIRPPVPNIQEAGGRKREAGGRIQNPIDNFILARLEQEKLQPSPEADKTTLLRRVSLDLTGLPPTPDEVDAFLADKSPAAYEKVVDRLLASPRYGERMAMSWLDGARFADTHGYQNDFIRDMSLWRDWVINAFNQNEPFDQFTLEQLAGDLLPHPTMEQRVATGFNRNHRINTEAGSIPEEWRTEYVIDRVETMSAVWLGLTLGCCRCHDHKFDPIAQKEFYSVCAYFNSVAEDGGGNELQGNHPPKISMARPEQTTTIAAAKKKVSDLNLEIGEVAAKLHYEDPAEKSDGEVKGREDFVWVEDDVPAGAKPAGTNGDWVWVSAPDPVQSGKRAMKRSGVGSHQHYFTNANPPIRVGFGDRLFAYVYLDPANPPKAVMVQFNAGDGKDDWEHRAYWGDDIIEYGKGQPEPAHKRLGNLPKPGGWRRLTVKASDVGLQPGAVLQGMAFSQADGTAFWDTAGIATATPQQAEDFVWVDDDTPAGAKLEGDWQWVTAPEITPVSGKRAMKRTGGGTHQHFFTGATQPLLLRGDDQLFSYVWLDPKNPPKTVMLQFNDGSWEHRAYWGADAAFLAGTPDGPNHHLVGPLPALGQWVRLQVDVKMVGLGAGSKLNGWAFTQADGLAYWDKAGTHTWSPPDDLYLKSLQVWEQRLRAGGVDAPPEIKEATKKRDDANLALVRNYYLGHVCLTTRPQLETLTKQLDEQTALIKKTEMEILTTMVMEDLPKPRETHILIRGQYDKFGDLVAPGVPAALPPLPANAPPNRLGLAQWIMAPTNPLTARVAVNRLWEKFFGIGLVKTSENFGSQAEWPSHPELLDWLATEFVRLGWDLKAMQKEIVLSATYRQTSKLDPKLLVRDPENRLLSHGPRFRLSAEEIRDQALAISGLLVEKIGGPSVKPYQPPGVWEELSTVREYVQETGPNLYRRSLYSFLKRTVPPPNMAILDAPSREYCVVKRPRTNTPLQALGLLNDMTYVECSRVLAQRMMTEGGTTPEQRISYAFRRATARPPNAIEMKILLTGFQNRLTVFRADAEAAKKLVSIGESKRDEKLDVAELAAYATTASIILNLDKTVTKE